MNAFSQVRLHDSRPARSRIEAAGRAFRQEPALTLVAPVTEPGLILDQARVTAIQAALDATAESPQAIGQECRAPAVNQIHVVQRIVAEHFGISKVELLAHRRDGALVTARHVGMYLAQRCTPQSLPAIGRRFDRDHSSVLSAVRKIAERIETDTALAATVDALETQIRIELGTEGWFA